MWKHLLVTMSFHQSHHLSECQKHKIENGTPNIGVLWETGEGVWKGEIISEISKRNIWSYKGVYGWNKSINTLLIGASSNPLIFAILMVPIKQAPHDPTSNNCSLYRWTCQSKTNSHIYRPSVLNGVGALWISEKTVVNLWLKGRSQHPLVI